MNHYTQTHTHTLLHVFGGLFLKVIAFACLQPTLYSFVSLILSLLLLLTAITIATAACYYCLILLLLLQLQLKAKPQYNPHNNNTKQKYGVCVCVSVCFCFVHRKINKSLCVCVCLCMNSLITVCHDKCKWVVTHPWAHFRSHTDVYLWRNRNSFSFQWLC